MEIKSWFSPQLLPQLFLPAFHQEKLPAFLGGITSAFPGITSAFPVSEDFRVPRSTLHQKSRKLCILGKEKLQLFCFSFRKSCSFFLAESHQLFPQEKAWVFISRKVAAFFSAQLLVQGKHDVSTFPSPAPSS